MFTTIEKLRASHAMQSRVTTVENWLKRQNSAWTPDAKFPIAFIAHSNAVDDVEWVNQVTSTHVTWSELANEVLKEFGHKTQGEHRAAIEEMLRSREGKTKVLNEIIVPKYNAAFQRIGGADFGSAFWPFALSKPAATTEAAAPEATASAASNDAATESTATDAAAPETGKLIPVVPDFSIEGAFYIAIGKIMVSKSRNFIDAVKYASSPTGGRLYSEYAMAEGVDGKAARDYVRQYLAQQATTAQAA